jgi:hypothetical protein
MRDFATQQGYYVDENKTIYTDSSMTTVVPATEEGMIKALATSNVINDINNKMGQIVNLLSKNPQAAEVFD